MAEAEHGGEHRDHIDEGADPALDAVADERVGPDESLAPAPAVEIVAGGVVVRLDGATSAARIAEIAAALEALR